MKIFYKKFFVILSGILVCFFMLETVLTVFGSFYLYKCLNDSPHKKENSDFVIFCVGDSFTVDLGPSYGKSYPQLLQESLSRNNANRTIKVINKGVGGFNSAMIRRRFEEYIEKSNPDLVLLLAGGANMWDAWGYREYLNKKTLVGLIRDKLYRIKAFKLTKLLFNEARLRFLDSIKGADSRWISPEALKIVNEFKPNIRIEGRLDDDLLKRISLCGRYIPVVVKRCYEFAKFHMSQRNFREARHFFRKAIALSPESLWPFPPYAIAVTQESDVKVRNKEIQFLKTMSRHNQKMRKKLKDLIEMLTNRKRYQIDISEWIALDIKEMIKVCRAKNITVLLQTYPVNDRFPYAELSYVNSILREIAQTCDVPLIDHGKVFEELSWRGENINLYFKGRFDLHCNQLGNQLVVRNIISLMKDEKLLDAQGRLKGVLSKKCPR